MLHLSFNKQVGKQGAKNFDKNKVRHSMQVVVVAMCYDDHDCVYKTMCILVYDKKGNMKRGNHNDDRGKSDRSTRSTRMIMRVKMYEKQSLFCLHFKILTIKTAGLRFRR